MESLIWILGSLAAFILLVQIGLRLAKRLYSAATVPTTSTSTSKVTAQFGNNEGEDNA